MADLPHDSTLVLVAGPLVRATSWEPTAQLLRQAGRNVLVPEVVASPRMYPAWRDWAAHLAALCPAGQLVLVGHSSATVLVAQLSAMVDTEALILADGLVPPAAGAVGPAPNRILGMLDALRGNDHRLPPWCDLWIDSAMLNAIGVSALQSDGTAFEEFRRALPLMRRACFDDTVERRPWRHQRVGYLQLTSLYAQSADEAVTLGWPVLRLNGTHMHPTTCPAETAAAIESLCTRLQVEV